MSEVVRIDEDGPEAAREALERCVGAGGVAIFPADGLYGLACDPMGPAAVERIHELKGRPARKSSAVMYFSAGTMRELVGDMSDRVRAAAAALLPGPVTLVIPNPARRYPLACREDPERLGVRLIEGALAGSRYPVFQTSANLAGEPPAADFAEIDVRLLGGVDLAIDGGELTGQPSTVIDLTPLDFGGRWEVLREGALGREAVAHALAGVA